MAVNIYGLPVDRAPVEALVKNYNLKIIEDVAQAIGQTCYVMPCEIFGDLSTISFYPSKRVAVSEGDIVLSED
jgi:perosamine synthetase